MHLKGVLRLIVYLLSSKHPKQVVFSVCAVTLGKLNPLPRDGPLRCVHAQLATTILDAIRWCARDFVLQSLTRSQSGVNPVVALAQLALELDPSCMNEYYPEDYIHSFVRELLAMSTSEVAPGGRPTPGSITTDGVGAVRLANSGDGAPTGIEPDSTSGASALFERLEPTITATIVPPSRDARSTATSAVRLPRL